MAAGRRGADGGRGPMSTDRDDLADRLTAVESAAAHHERTIADLSQMIAEQWTVIDTLKARLAALSETVEEVVAGAGDADPQKRPPHW